MERCSIIALFASKPVYRKPDVRRSQNTFDVRMDSRSMHVRGCVRCMPIQIRSAHYRLYDALYSFRETD